jgi:hypothetical protein
VRIDGTQKPGLFFTIDNSRSKPVIISALAPLLGKLWYGSDRKGKKGWHHWQLVMETEPGHRFQTHYNNHRQRRGRDETSRYGRIFHLLGGPTVVRVLRILAILTCIVALGYWLVTLFSAVEIADRRALSTRKR